MAGFKLGDRGPAVAEIRARLARLGLLPGSRYAEAHAGTDPLDSGPLTDVAEPAMWETTALVSAEFDDAVEAAVRTFQQQRGITVDGVVGSETFRRLEEARWRLGDRVLSYAAAHQTVGEDVLELQQRLNAMGFSCGREDGQLGPHTDAAIREFQRNTGLRADGVCGPDVFRALGRLRRTAGQQSGQPVRERYSLSDIRTGMRGKIVVIDPGAARKDTRESLDEASICADLAARIEGRLTAVGTQVVVSRPLAASNAADAEAARAAFCNEVGADLLVNLTLADDPDRPGGVATYYYGREHATGSVPGQLAAGLLLDGIIARTDLGDQGRHARTWDLLRMTRMPAVRVEIGNLGHPGDRARLADQRFVDTLARGICDAIERFFSPAEDSTGQF